MTTSRPDRTVVVSCTRCDAIIGAVAHENGSFTPLGSEDDCSCGGDAFRRLR